MNHPDVSSAEHALPVFSPLPPFTPENAPAPAKGARYTSFDELPLTLSLTQTATVLGISRSAAYALAAGDCEGTPPLPVLRIGGRTLVPKEALIDWIRANTRPAPK